MAATVVTASWSEDLGTQPLGARPALPLQWVPNPWGGLAGFSLGQLDVPSCYRKSSSVWLRQAQVPTPGPGPSSTDAHSLNTPAPGQQVRKGTRPGPSHPTGASAGTSTVHLSSTHQLEPHGGRRLGLWTWKPTAYVTLADLAHPLPRTPAFCSVPLPQAYGAQHIHLWSRKERPTALRTKHRLEGETHVRGHIFVLVRDHIGISPPGPVFTSGLEMQIREWPPQRPPVWPQGPCVSC